MLRAGTEEQRVCVARSLVLCVGFVDRCFFPFVLLAIVLSVLRYADSDYPFGIFKSNPVISHE
jgi:hypothetical protein